MLGSFFLNAAFFHHYFAQQVLVTLVSQNPHICLLTWVRLLVSVWSHPYVQWYKMCLQAFLWGCCRALLSEILSSRDQEPPLLVTQCLNPLHNIFCFLVVYSERTIDLVINHWWKSNRVLRQPISSHLYLWIIYAIKILYCSDIDRPLYQHFRSRMSFICNFFDQKNKKIKKISKKGYLKHWRIKQFFREGNLFDK